MKTIYFSALLFSALLLPGQIFGQLSTPEEVSPVAVMTMLGENALLVDVREVNEVEVLAYGVSGVVNLPLSELPDRLAELPRDRPIVLACRSGERSKKAAALLAQNSFTQLFILKGGIIAWEANVLPVEKTERAAEVPTGGKQCGSGGATGKSCGDKKAGAEAATCGEKGKGKTCCAKGSR